MPTPTPTGTGLTSQKLTNAPVITAKNPQSSKTLAAPFMGAFLTANPVVGEMRVESFTPIV
jgi:hypothetical protein